METLLTNGILTETPILQSGATDTRKSILKTQPQRDDRLK
jgi:hypothetical protein